MPAWQNLEQHSPCEAHGFPDVRQPESGTHFPDEHLPPQHSPSAEHAALSAVHWLLEQAPLTHANVQQSGPAWHGAPEPRQALPPLAQTCVVGSH
jgi:hypothetical protein